MVLTTILWVIVLVILALFLGKILSFALRVTLFMLVITLGVMLVFGWSFNEVLSYALNLLAWAF